MQPETITDQPVPLIDGSTLVASGSASSPVTANSVAETPQVITDVVLPDVPIAVETNSQSIDTETKRIKGNYTFESLGAISIGEFAQGVSGAIKISPDGISGININGDQTFAIDGSTGDASFAGTLEAGTIISGAMNVGSPSVVIDGLNGRIIVNDGTHDRVLIGYLLNGY
jgi:hypothetical protein